MVYITNSGRMWLAGMAVSLAIFGVLFFTVIKPSSDTANQAMKSGMQETQKILDQTGKQLNAVGGQAATAGAAATTAGQAGTAAQTAAGSAQQAVNKAAKLASCITAAGSDVAQVQACQVRYSH
jgi:Tfp pilus assembly protein FimV